MSRPLGLAARSPDGASMHTIASPRGFHRAARARQRASVPRHVPCGPRLDGPCRPALARAAFGAPIVGRLGGGTGFFLPSLCESKRTEGVMFK